MIAHFPSKLFKRARAILALCLFQVCLLGTHWVGFTHSIAHAGLQQQSINQSSSNEVIGTLHHGSDLCHLFDALSLAGFVPEVPFAHSTINADNLSVIARLKTQVAQTSSSAYLSRAPPFLPL